MLTAIIPIDLSQRAIDIITKTKKMLLAADASNVNIIFGHNNRNTIYDKIFLKIIEKFENCQVTSRDTGHDVVNTSKLRNEAFKKVISKHIILLDIDIWPDFEILKKYSNNILKGEQPFYILPCLYLTKLGSHALIKEKLSIQELTNKYFNFSRKEFLHLASPSSVTIMSSLDYIKLGGFDEKFSGHGYEDFDFLIRLGIYHNKIEPTLDFLTNANCRSPLFCQGFKRQLGELCIEALLSKDIVFHIYHEKLKESDYYKSRLNNQCYFQGKYKNFTTELTYKDPTLITTFLEFCKKRNIDIHNFSILFDNKPGHIDRFDTLKRRVNFLLQK